MKTALKWIGIIAAGVVVLVGVVAVGLSIMGRARFNETSDVQAERIVIPTGEAAVGRGEHLVNTACKSCHGDDLTGRPMIDEPPIGTVYATNITGVANTHSDDDLVLAIRHGLDADGRQLVVMPAESFIHFSEEDLGAVIAYLKTLPRTGAEWPEPRLHPVGRMLMGAGMLEDMFPASYIDHEMPFHEMPGVGANEAYGEYLARFCWACHGENLAGGQPAAPGSPPAPNLTPAGVLGDWTQDEFLTAMRTGVTPSGRQLNPAFMPWPSFGKFHDEELRGLWMYLESLPPRQTTTE